MDKDEKRMMKAPGFVLRVSVSIVAFFGLIIFYIVWLFFYAGTFDIYQNIAIFLVSILAFIAIMGAMWASWGMKYGDKRCEKDNSKGTGGSEKSSKNNNKNSSGKKRKRTSKKK